MKARTARRDAVPLLLIAGGLLWLLAETGIVPLRVWGAIWFYGPLLLVGVGLDLLRVRRPWAVPYTAIAVAIVVLAALVVPRSGALPEATAFQEPLGATRSAAVQLALSSSPTRVYAVQDGTSLIDARVSGRPTASFDVRGGVDKTITVRATSTGSWFAAPFGSHRWDLGLTPSVPLALAIDGGSGPATLELADLRISELQLDGGSGGVSLTLPGDAGGYRASLRGGSGPTRVDVGRGASLDLTLDMGSGSTDLTLPSDVDARVGVRGGSGPITIDVPSDARVRLNVLDDGSGPLRVASFLVRRSGSGDTGTWESASATGTPAAIVITVTSAGSGPISIR